jgi:O-antigen ligase
VDRAVENALRGLAVALAGLGVAVGLLAGVHARYALAVAIAVLFIAVVLANFTLGVCLFAFITFLDLTAGISTPVVGLTKLAGLLLALGWLALVTTRADRGRTLLAAHPAFSYLLLLFLVWTCASFAWAENDAAVTDALSRYLLNFALFVVVFTAVRTRRHAALFAAAFVAGAAVAAAYGVLYPAETADAYSVARSGGTIGDPNEFAAVLIGGLALAGALAARRSAPPGWRIASAGAAVLCLAGIVLSVSRGGLIALGVALLVAIVFGGRWRRRVASLALLVIVSSVSYFALLAPYDVVARVTTVESGSGRTDIWTVGWRMVEAHPVRGVGAGNFPVSSVHYLLQPGALPYSRFIVDDPKIAHNTYLGALAEQGVIGALLFLAIVGFSLRCTSRARRIFRREGDRESELLAYALLVGMAGMLAAAFFISAEFNKQLWLLAAFGPALLHVARKSAAEPRAAEPLKSPGPAAEARPALIA